jgi:hypothetical protein
MDFQGLLGALSDAKRRSHQWWRGWSWGHRGRSAAAHAAGCAISRGNAPLRPVNWSASIGQILIRRALTGCSRLRALALLLQHVL